MRKYTLDYYLEYLKKIDTKRLKDKLTKFCNTTVFKIQEEYKHQVKGKFIDYVEYIEDFYMIITYEIEDMTAVAFNIIRYKDGNKHQQYYSLCYKHYFSNEVEWRRVKFNYMSKRYCYTGNLKVLFKDTEYKYSKVWILANNIDFKIRNLLAFCNASHIRTSESLIELKCYKLARDIIDGHCWFRDDTNVIKAIGLNSFNEMKKVIEHNMSADDLTSYRNFVGLNLDWKYFRLLKSFLKYYSFPNIEHFTFQSFFDYYLSQLNSREYYPSFYNFLSDYKDYIGFCKKLKYDLDDTKYYKPYNFKIAHDQAYFKVESARNKYLDSCVKKILKKYQCLNFVKGDYCIVVPKFADDIRQEGIDNKNCVGGYVCRVKDGNSIICFVRHSVEPNKSFYTLELNPKDLRVVQCRGYKNNPTPEEKQVNKFVEYWRKHIVLKELKVG